VLTWKWQHYSFIRSIVPLVVQTLLLFPIFLTFIFQSRGGSFFGNLNDLDGDFQADVNFHIASFCLIAGVAIFQQIMVRYILKKGLFDHGSTPGTVLSRFRKKKKRLQRGSLVGVVVVTNSSGGGANSGGGSGGAGAPVVTVTDKEVDAMVEEELYPHLRADIHDAPWTSDLYVQKLIAILCMGTSVIFCVSLVKGDIREANSGIIIFTIIYFAMAVVVMFYNIIMLMRAKHYKEWWLAYRAVAGLHLFVAYICFWLTLFLIVLVGHDHVGFWNAVGDLTPKRSAVIYVHIAIYFALLFVVAMRIYHSKLRKKGRQSRVLDAVKPTQADIDAMAKHERDEVTHRKELLDLVKKNQPQGGAGAGAGKEKQHDDEKHMSDVPQQK